MTQHCPPAIEVIKDFSKASGLILNLCELMALKQCGVPLMYDIPMKDQVTYLGTVIKKD